MKYVRSNSAYIKHSLEALLLYYDYFFFGIVLPKVVDYRFVKSVCHKMLRQLIKIAYYCRFFVILCKTELLQEEFLIRKKTKGEWPSTIILHKVNNHKLQIVKQVASHIIFDKEKAFYERYHNNDSNICLCDMTFTNSNEIRMPFIKQKSLSRLICEGKVSYRESISLFEVISSELRKFYSNQNQALIHGDFGLLNIYPIAVEPTQDGPKKFCMIDYSDSHIYSIKYDLFILLSDIIFCFHVDDRKQFLRQLKISENEFDEFEKHFRECKKKKHPFLIKDV